MCISRLWRLCAVAPFVLTASILPAHGGEILDTVPRTVVMSAYTPELELLKGELTDRATHTVNGLEFSTGRLQGQDVVMFLSGVSIVNATMTAQLALERFNVERIIFSGIAGGVDPSLRIGAVAIPDRWGQYLEAVFAREGEQEGEWVGLPPFFEYPYRNFGMMHPRSVRVSRADSDGLEARFWFPVDEDLLALAREAVSGVALERCGRGLCLEHQPAIIVGGSGVSGGAFVDNADFREYVFDTFQAQVLDMESAAVAHVAYANDVPFIAVRSVADLAGGGPGENEVAVFFGLAADNAATIVKALLERLE